MLRHGIWAKIKAESRPSMRVFMAGFITISILVEVFFLLFVYPFLSLQSWCPDVAAQ